MGMSQFMPIASIYGHAVLVLILTAIQLVNLVIFRLICRHQSLSDRISSFLMWLCQAHIVYFISWVAPCQVRVHFPKTDDKKSGGASIQNIGSKNSLVILNHHYDIDWLIGMMVAERAGVLGNTLPFAKREIKYVPILGWFYALTGAQFLERSLSKDRHTLSSSVATLAKYPDPVWLVLLAEGTRYTPAKYEASCEFQRNRGILPVLKHHLLPRPGGFCEIISSMSAADFPVLLDITLCFRQEDEKRARFENVASSAIFQSQSPIVADAIIRQIPLDTIPSDKESCKQFLYDLYREKDELKDCYIKSDGTRFMPDTPDGSACHIVRCTRQIRTLCVGLSVFCLIVLPTAALLLYITMFGDMLAKLMVISFVVGLQFVLDKLIRLATPQLH